MRACIMRKNLEICFIFGILLSLSSMSSAQEGPVDYNEVRQEEKSAVAPVYAPDTRGEYFSPFSAERIYSIAHELWGSPKAGPQEYEQAIILLNSVLHINDRAHYIYDDLIKLAGYFPGRDYSKMVFFALNNYISSAKDLAPAESAVRYLMGKANTREQRQSLLDELIRTVGEQNRLLGSDLYLERGFLSAETADSNSAMQYFMRSYDLNPFNSLAFDKIVELSEGDLNPAGVIRQMFLRVVHDRLDLSSAAAAGDYCYGLGLYEQAYQAYRYAAGCYEYLYPERNLPASIYIPWAYSACNTTRYRNETGEIAEKVRSSGRFDIVVEAISAKAAVQMGNTNLAERILNEARSRAQEMAESESEDKRLASDMLAWFYSFAERDKDKALAWANKAYANEPNDPEIASLFGLTLSMNEHYGMAKEYAHNCGSSQICLISRALIDMDAGDDANGISLLKRAVSIEPGSLEADYARSLLSANDAEYIPPIDIDILSKGITEMFGNEILKPFAPPSKLLSARFNMSDKEIPYAADINCDLIIGNLTDKELVIDSGSFFKGLIRVDAEIQGSLRANIAGLIETRIRPAEYIRPGRSIAIPMRLKTGPLREILHSYPQADLEVTLKCLLDPIIDEQGNVESSLGIEPVTVKITRKGVGITNRFLVQRLEYLNEGHTGQRMRAVELFCGLAAEMQALESLGSLPYKLMQAEKPLVYSAIVKGLRDKDWTVKVQAITSLEYVNPNYTIVQPLAELVHHENWVIRMLAVYRLAGAQQDGQAGFEKVLQWVARNDANELVRDMAGVFGADFKESEAPK